jgi:hypothetical protein
MHTTSPSAPILNSQFTYKKRWLGAVLQSQRNLT